MGQVFKLNREGDGWIFTSLYQFKGGNDGSGPYHGGVVFGPDGSLYGTTAAGGGTGGACANFADEYVGCGVVYNLRPSISFCRSVLCPWTETVLYRFQGHEDGSAPLGNLVFDGSGNLYGVTYYGGPNSTGTVYKLSLSSGGWTKTTIYTFSGGSDGASPADGLTMDVFGNLYGTTLFGGAFGGGTVFMLTPSGGAWSKTILYNFTGGDDGANPYAAVVFDRSGNLYGNTRAGQPSSLHRELEVGRSIPSKTSADMSTVGHMVRSLSMLLEMCTAQPLTITMIIPVPSGCWNQRRLGGNIRSFTILRMVRMVQTP